MKRRPQVSSSLGTRAWIDVLLCVAFLITAAKGVDEDLDGAILNVMAGCYDPFYDQARHMTRVGALCKGHVAGAPLDPDANQKTLRPTSWINMTVIGDGPYKAKMMLRNENLYFLAFLNRIGQLFFMKGYGKLFEGLGGIELPFGESYPELMGRPTGGARLLVGLPLGRDAAKWAARTMSEYGIDETISMEEVRRACATMSVMGPEGLRLKNVRMVYTGNLDEVSNLGESETNCINNWASMSVGLFCEGQEGCMTGNLRKALTKVGLWHPEMWDGILDVIMRPHRMALDGSLIPKKD